MKAIIDFLVWAGMKDVVAKALLAFLGLLFVVAPLIIGAYNIYYQIKSMGECMDKIILHQELQTITNNQIKEKIEVLEYNQFISQDQTSEDIDNISKTIEKTNLGIIDIIKTFHKTPVNIDLIEHQEREIKVFISDNLPHKKERKERRIIAVPNPSMKPSN